MNSYNIYNIQSIFINVKCYFKKIVARVGFEPTQTAPKTGVLPLDDRALYDGGTSRDRTEFSGSSDLRNHQTCSRSIESFNRESNPNFFPTKEVCYHYHY